MPFHMYLFRLDCISGINNRVMPLMRINQMFTECCWRWWWRCVNDGDGGGGSGSKAVFMHLIAKNGFIGNNQHTN